MRTSHKFSVLWNSCLLLLTLLTFLLIRVWFKCGTKVGFVFVFIRVKHIGFLFIFSFFWTIGGLVKEAKEKFLYALIPVLVVAKLKSKLKLKKLRWNFQNWLKMINKFEKRQIRVPSVFFGFDSTIELLSSSNKLEKLKLLETVFWISWNINSL